MMSITLVIQKVRKDGNIREKLLPHITRNYVRIKSKIHQHRRSESETEKSDRNRHDVDESREWIYRVYQTKRAESSHIHRDYRTGNIFRGGTRDPPSWQSDERAIPPSHAKHHPPYEHHPTLDCF